MNIRAERLFDGEQWIEDAVVSAEQELITSVMPFREFGGKVDAEVELLVPSFIDVQVYGAGGRLFSQYPTADTLFLMEDIFQKQGTCIFQPTIATNDPAVIKEAIYAFRQYQAKGGKAAVGLHLEGPWINTAMKGAHLDQFIVQPQPQDVQQLMQMGGDAITMVTLAPEQCTPEVLHMLHDAPFILSAGHSAIQLDDAAKIFADGTWRVTHLFNAMSGLHHRTPGLAAAAMRSPVLCSIIPDGFHVHAEMVRLAVDAMGDKLFAITDAVTDTSEGPYRHMLAEGYYSCNGVLSGSAISMMQAFENLRSWGISDEQALRMCSTLPAKALNLHKSYGKIKTGYKACFNVLSKGFGFVKTICS